MNFSSEQALDRLASNEHGVLATLHPTRGVDLVPVVYTVVDGHVCVPVDRVKPKASERLQRERNLELDPAATLLIEHWDRTDWSALWWVRAQLRWIDHSQPGSWVEVANRAVEQLADRFTQYSEPHHNEPPLARILVFDIEAAAGWAAQP